MNLKKWNMFFLHPTENHRFQISAFALTIAIVSCSFAFPIATFTKSDFFLILVVALSIATLTACVTIAQLKWILLLGLFSLIAAITAIVYGLLARSGLLQPFILFLQLHYNFLFNL